ncbi:MAG: hypothetical protein AB7O52_06770 [Planctomycetota bacterium]
MRVLPWLLSALLLFVGAGVTWAESPFLRGDTNADGSVNIADAVTELSYLFGGAPLSCADAADANDDGQLDLADVVFLLSYTVGGGSQPLPPPGGGSCGQDPTPDGLGCAAHAACGPSAPLEFLFPMDGQAIDYEGSYIFGVTGVAGAQSYRFTMSQGGGVLYSATEVGPGFALWRGHPSRVAFSPYVPVAVQAEVQVGGSWFVGETIEITLVPRRQTVKVLELRFFPLDGSGNLDASETDFPESLVGIRNRVNTISAGTVLGLENGTRYVNDPLGQPYLDYQIVASLEFLIPVPRSTVFAPPGGGVFANHFEILEQLVDIQHWVEVEGVRDVWIWMYHTAEVVPIESNMAMGTVSQAHFNHGTYGDISNSYQQNDLPVLAHTYAVYDFNYSRWIDEALHNYGHQRERLMSFANSALFGEFVNPHSNHTGVINHCGNVHFPPNSPGFDYQYTEATAVLSDCGDWRPGGGGAVESVDCSHWGCTHRGFLEWWFRRFPGSGNTLSLGGVRLRNWNEFVWDFDAAVVDGRRLTE